MPLGTFGADFEPIRADVFTRAKQSYSIDLEAEGYQRGGQANPYASGKFASSSPPTARSRATNGKKTRQDWQVS